MPARNKIPRTGRNGASCATTSGLIPTILTSLRWTPSKVKCLRERKCHETHRHGTPAFRAVAGESDEKRGDRSRAAELSMRSTTDSGVSACHGVSASFSGPFIDGVSRSHGSSNMNVVTIALLFLLSAAVVVFAGTILARNGDIIAARTKLGGVWVGAVFLAAATSLPELATDVAAVRMGEPDLAAGDLFGSSMANMLILAILTLLPVGKEIFRAATLDHVVYAALAITLTTLAALFVLVPLHIPIPIFGAGSLIILAAYVFGSRTLMKHSALAERTVKVEEMRPPVADPAAGGDAVQKEVPLRRAVTWFVFAAFITLLAAPVFAFTAERAATLSGVGTTFLGTWLVGFSTSLPELVTSLAAVRMRAYDLAVGNLFGSNAFNMTLFVVLDAAHTDGPIFAAISQAHVLSALAAILLMCIAVAALVTRAKGRTAVSQPGGALMVLVYVLGLLLLLSQSRGA
jgi:cation:H+ antiporter